MIAASSGGAESQSKNVIPLEGVLAHPLSVRGGGGGGLAELADGAMAIRHDGISVLALAATRAAVTRSSEVVGGGAIDDVVLRPPLLSSS